MSEKRRQKLLLFGPVLILFLCMACASALYLRTYQRAVFEHLSAFCETAAESAPETEDGLLGALKEYGSLTEREVRGSRYLAEYGYRAEQFCKGLPWEVCLIFLALFLVTAIVFICAAAAERRRNRRLAAELTVYLEQVNTGAGGTLIKAPEDDFSHLRDEIHKTVTMLWQTKEAAVAAKIKFAENLDNIAHQMKTPVTAALLSCQMMKREAANPYAEQIGKQMERLNRLGEALLTLSRIDAGVLPLKSERVDICTVLNLAAENLEDLLTKNHVSVVIPDKECIDFSGDLEWTMEAVMNLMKNCMEHSPDGGSIHCDYAENPLYAEITIWDEGEGFDPEDLPRLFERFYRGKGSISNGIGIGLALARSVFELQNGTVSARNLPGGGACFEIRIYSH